MKKILAIVFGICVSLQAYALNSIIVFGDSLSDNGNLYEYMQHQLPESPPYYKGHFSDGCVWIERVARMYYGKEMKAHFLDYAFGGAGVMLPEEEDEDVLFTFKKEIDSYLMTHDDKADPNALFVVWIGANNYLGLSEDKEETLNSVLLGLKINVKRLIDAGAKHILIVNLPDLGIIPAARAFNAVDLLKYYSAEHNARLINMVNNFKVQYPDVEWIDLDVYAKLHDVLEHQENYEFDNVKDPCLSMTASMNKLIPSRSTVLNMASSDMHTNAPEAGCKKYLFFDLVHPTAQAHIMLAGYAKLKLDQAGVVFE
jgi:phospholipase/lecithinase/hemolysin